MRTGASLVPVFNFGENSLYNTVTDNEQGSKLRHWQERMKSMFGFTLPLVHGRGVWNYSYGLLPFRVPLTTVIGKPIPTKKNPNPSQEEITHYHTCVDILAFVSLISHPSVGCTRRRYWLCTSAGASRWARPLDCV